MNSRDNDALQEVNTWIPRRGDSQARLAMEQSWLRNLFYFGGKQHFAIIGSQIVELAPGENEIRYKANLIKPAILRAVTKLMAIQGRFGAVPASQSLKDRDSARISEQVFRHQMVRTNYQREKQAALIWAACCGSSFFKNTWDPKGGDIERFYWWDKVNKSVRPVESISPEERQQLERDGAYDDTHTGEVSCEAISPFQIHYDSMSKGKIQHCRRIHQVQWLPRDYLAEAFGVEEVDLKTEESSDASRRWEDALALMSSGLQGQYMGFPSEEKDRHYRVRLTQSWERPSKKYKRGRYIVVAGDRVMVNTDNPYAADQTGALHLPFTKLDWVMMPGRFWGLSLVEDLISPQFRYNESRARTAEFENLAARPVTVVPKNCGIAPSGLEIGTYKVYEYNQAVGKPEFITPPQIPTEVAVNAEKASAEIRSLSSQSEIDGAKMPGQLRSGLAVNAVNKERDIVLDLTGFNMLETDKDNGRQFLALARLFYDNERLVAMRGSNGEWSIKSFVAADLRNDIRVIGEPGELETSDQYQNRLLEFLQVGALQPATNPQDKQIVAKAIKFQTAEEFITDFTQHEERQEEEIRRMAANPQAYLDQPYPVMPFEDDVAHMRVLERLFNNLDEWEALNPRVQSVIAMHWEMHQRSMAQKQMQQMQMMLQAKEAAIPSAQPKGAASQPSR